MKTAVIVSTYNRPDALKKVLDGLMHQTCLPDEIIIADDGSTDDTRQMLFPYLSHTRIHIKQVWHEDKGFRLAEIRNKAIKVTKSDYIVFLDGDCIPCAHFVEDHKALAQEGFFFQGKRVIVKKKVSGEFSFNDVGSYLNRMKHLLLFNISNSHHIFRIPFFPSYASSRLSGIRGCNMAFFKKDLLTVNGFNQQFKGWGREDSEIVLRMFKYGIKRKEHPFRAVCYHLWHEENKRDTLAANDQILENAFRSNSYFCSNGINKSRENMKDT